MTNANNLNGKEINIIYHLLEIDDNEGWSIERFEDEILNRLEVYYTSSRIVYCYCSQPTINTIELEPYYIIYPDSKKYEKLGLINKCYECDRIFIFKKK